MNVTYSASTDIGRQRQVNQDNYGVSDDTQSEQLGQLLVVCDGMGGHAAGEIASQIGVDVILHSFYTASIGAPEHLLAQAFEQANQRIHAEGRGGMGTTGVALLLFDQEAIVANVGDSRAYLLRAGTIRQLTRDHSYVQEQVDAHLLTPEQARISQYRNMITRALGYRANVSVDIFRTPLQVDDCFLLSTDGLHGLLEDEELLEIVSTHALGHAVSHLVDLANERGGHDNITVVLARIDALNEDKGVRFQYETPPTLAPSAEAAHNAPTQPLPVGGMLPAHPPTDASTEKSGSLRSRLNRLLGLMLLLLLIGGVVSLLLLSDGFAGITLTGMPTATATLIVTLTPIATDTPVPVITPITPAALETPPPTQTPTP
ncbi:MAG: Stp1/IreP family PP2C-type Ser/Thr phosphatase [Chloroflexaceae bacterium]|nr:Stp1/IreP family PP2C-type Ser/Thr phosphatase [Chloroflexaceae bacterium]